MQKPFNFDECVEVFLQIVLAALAEHGDAIRALNDIEPLWAISFDIIPWQPYVGLAFRLMSESEHGASSNSADWTHSHFIENLTSKPLQAAADFVTTICHNFDQDLWPEVTHVLYLAGAHAVMDTRVSRLLQSFGLDAPEIHDRIEGAYFKYFVIDSDACIAANYCDIVRANRATKFLLGRIV